MVVWWVVGGYWRIRWWLSDGQFWLVMVNIVATIDWQVNSWPAKWLSDGTLTVHWSNDPYLVANWLFVFDWLHDGFLMVDLWFIDGWSKITW